MPLSVWMAESIAGGVAGLFFWIHTKTATTELITQNAGIELPSSVELEEIFAAYVIATGPLAESDWGRNSLTMNNCKLP